MVRTFELTHSRGVLILLNCLVFSSRRSKGVRLISSINEFTEIIGFASGGVWYE